MLSVSSPSLARAYEGQFGVGVDVGYGALLGGTGVPAHSVPIGLSFWWGLGDTFQLQTRLTYAPHPAAPPLHLGTASIELVYLLDVLRVVPFLGIGVDLLYLRWGPADAFEPAAHLLLGLDYLIDRRWIVGLDFRPFILPLEIPARGFAPVIVTASLRLTMSLDQP